MSSEREEVEKEVGENEGGGEDLNQVVKVEPEDTVGPSSNQGEDVQLSVESANVSSDDDCVKTPKKKKRKVKKRKQIQNTEAEPWTLPPSLDFNKLDEFYLTIVQPGQIATRQSVSLTEKMAIVERINNGESQCSVAKSLKLGRSTVQNIWANRDKFKKFAEEGDGGRKKCRMPISQDLEKLVMSWVEDMQNKGTPANGPAIRETAKVLAKGLGINDFTASSGWLDNFKMRNKIILPKSRKNLQSEDGTPKQSNQTKRRKKETKSSKSQQQLNNNDDADEGDWDLDDFLDSVHDSDSPIPTSSTSCDKTNTPKPNAASMASAAAKKLIRDWILNTWTAISEGHAPNDIFFVGEFGLFYKVLPEAYKTFEGSSCYAGDYPRERLGIMFGTNFLGSERLKLVTVGSSKHPASFGGNWNEEDQNKLPTEYWSHPKALITNEMFEKWMQRLDQEMGQMQRKVLVVVANSTMHQKAQSNLGSSLKSIKIVILPPTFSYSPLHKLGARIVFEIKSTYRTLLLNKFTRNYEKGEALFTVLDALGLLSTAWLGIEQNAVADIFQKSRLISKDYVKLSVEEENQRKLDKIMKENNLLQFARFSGMKLPKELSFQRYVGIDDNLMAVESPDDNNFNERNFAYEDNQEVPARADPPPFHDLFNTLDDLRNWAVATDSSPDLNSLHNAISTIQKFCFLPAFNLNQTHSGNTSTPTPTNQIEREIVKMSSTNVGKNQLSTISTIQSTIDASAIQISQQNILSQYQYGHGIGLATELLGGGTLHTHQSSGDLHHFTSNGPTSARNTLYQGHPTQHYFNH